MLVDDLPPGPDAYPVSVLIRRQASNNRWVDFSWQVLGVLVNSQIAPDQKGVQVRAGDDADEFLWTGLHVCLYRDEAESYYFNLLAPQASLYVITRSGEQGRPEPFIVTASFDEANAYMESEENAYPVPMPAELYSWVEHFVLRHYVPEPRKKRKRKNWKENKHEQ